MSNRRAHTPTSPPEPPVRQSVRPSPDTLFDVLSNPYRRYALAQLARHGGELRVDELVERLVDWEAERGAPADPDRRRVASMLYHVHLPKLADVGLVEYDQEEATVAPGTEADVVKPFLDLISRQ
ncbi:DUF7344 domain-containing protein [Halomicrococcus sp. NG-SE-24]|uniref:DUF7344 domain-containing protein n=1 Tax=Halomicrococcus sp. NG-SE-24 TaxID=3436928 RepID=UPI003D95C24C